jgi:hypothetical protein
MQTGVHGTAMKLIFVVRVKRKNGKCHIEVL